MADPAAARAGEGRPPAGRPRSPQPCRQGPHRHPRDLPARRAVPHAGRRAGDDGHAGDGDPRASAAAHLRTPRHLRALRQRPGLPAPRPLQHQRPRAVLRDPQDQLRRRVRRVHGADERVDDGAGPLRGPPAPRAWTSPTSTSPSSSAGSPMPRARGATTSPPPPSPSSARTSVRASPAPSSRPSPRPTRRTSRPPPARSTSAGSRRSARPAPTCRCSPRSTPPAVRRG